MNYISITDFTTPKESRVMLSALERSGYRDRKLGIGVMMSRKTLLGLPTKWAGVFPKNKDVESIFIDHPLAFNVLHYADYDHETTEGSLEYAVRLGGPNLHAVQLDMPWPDPEMVNYVFSSSIKNYRLKVILQVGGKALEEVDNVPEAVVERLSEYDNRGILQYVLLDRSMGQGKPMDAQSLFPFIDAIRTSYPDVSIVVAGGLGPETIELARPIIERYPRKISIDAQGRLRPSGSALDPIDWSMAEEYLLKAIELFMEIEE